MAKSKSPTRTRPATRTGRPRVAEVETPKPSDNIKQVGSQQAPPSVPVRWGWLMAFGSIYLIWIAWLSYAAWVNIQAGNQ